MKLMGMTTRWELQTTNSVFDKQKTLICSMGNQQIVDIHFSESDIFAPVPKAHKARLLVTNTSQQVTKMYMHNTSQAF
jgi:hypothetical protein